MKYICKKCHFIYDEIVEKVKFNTLDKDYKCPNCGAEINDDNSTTCEYCRAIITRNTSKWVLSKKKSLNQRQL